MANYQMVPTLVSDRDGTSFKIGDCVRIETGGPTAYQYEGRITELDTASIELLSPEDEAAQRGVYALLPIEAVTKIERVEQ